MFSSSLILAVLPLLTSATRPTAKTTSGPITGLGDDQVNKYLGIPFAQSPPIRFGAPQAPKSWTTPLNTTTLKPSCIQQFNDPPRAREFITHIYNNPAPAESEDCLYLNVWTPANDKNKPDGGWPVMFWIYGGDVQFGYAGLPEYDGSHLAGERGVIVVTHNYRTNVFGFPNAPGLPTGQGNPGFLDQRAALAWNSANIANFGGNPQKVTIFGQSAGGYSVKQLIANPPSPLPFRAAIMQSQAQSPKNGPEAWLKITTAVGCADVQGEAQLECMRAVPASTLKAVEEKGSLGFAPIEDDVTNSHDFAAVVKSGRAAKVPVILGTTRNDGSAFALAFGFKASDALGSALPLPDVETSESITNLEFLCPTKMLSQVLVEANYPGVYRYFFNASLPQFAPFAGAGAFHAIELMPLFGTFRSEAEKELWTNASAVVQGAFVGFAQNPESGAGWTSQTSLIEGKLQEPIGVITLDGLRQRVGGLGGLEDSCAGLSDVIEATGL